jgi:hypothetical protein
MELTYQIKKGRWYVAGGRTEARTSAGSGPSVSEIIFGLIMALTFTGTLSAATAAREEIRTMMFAALGCNLAWGLVDGVMYLVQTLTERTRNFTLMRRVRSAVRPQELTRSSRNPFRAPRYAHQCQSLEEMRQGLVALPEPPLRGRLGWDDYVAAVGVFLVGRPHDLSPRGAVHGFQETAFAMRASNAVAVVTLFVAGYMLGRHSGGLPGDPARHGHDRPGPDRFHHCARGNG